MWAFRTREPTESDPKYSQMSTCWYWHLLVSVQIIKTMFQQTRPFLSEIGHSVGIPYAYNQKLLQTSNEDFRMIKKQNNSNDRASGLHLIFLKSWRFLSTVLETRTLLRRLQSNVLVILLFFLQFICRLLLTELPRSFLHCPNCCPKNVLRIRV